MAAQVGSGTGFLGRVEFQVKSSAKKSPFIRVLVLLSAIFAVLGFAFLLQMPKVMVTRFAYKSKNSNATRPEKLIINPLLASLFLLPTLMESKLGA